MISQMHVVIFEGSQWHSFAPIALGRPVFMLATGMSALLDKQIRHTCPNRLTLWVRPELEEACRRRIVPKLKIPTQVNVPLDNEPALLVSGRTLHFRKFEMPDEPAVVLDEGGVVRVALVRGMAGLSHNDALARTDRWLAVTRLPQMPPQARLVQRLWDLIKWNEESLVEDYAQTRPPHGARPAGAYHVIDDEHVWIGDGASIGPNAVLDASRGPVVIDSNASIGANSVLEGPCYVASYAQIAPQTLIRPGTTIGMMCRVGGEVSNTIMFGYSNKVHYGFLGDSYVGKWVNFGAGTTTSNLKNTYGEITVQTRGGPEKTGRRFLGSLVGDHSKTAIGTRLMAGSYLGFNSMVAVSGQSPKVVPSFTFLTDQGAAPYDLHRAMEVQKAVFSRRNRGWDEMDTYISSYVQQVAPTVEPPFTA
jgi:UDP-N-acetylglucosamine diphosphorylase / glucose-1-phosphate thymidylyltransferase / UDP-N-acetylgalactosamine diphosphorylase / glucosamine-1-phosphate N-acetyltransferase / galactosamine-1-phosphate N-acetyltransferase